MRNLLDRAYGHVLNGGLLDTIAAEGKFMTVPKGDLIMDVGDPIPGLPMLMEGAIKILRVDEEGDEMLHLFPRGRRQLRHDHWGVFFGVRQKRHPRGRRARQHSWSSCPVGPGLTIGSRDAQPTFQRFSL